MDSSTMNENLDTVLYKVNQLKSLDFWEPNAITVTPHVQSEGDMGPIYQSDNFGSNICGTTGRKLRLEGFGMNYEARYMQNPNEVPIIYYNIYSSTNKWFNTSTWGGFTGTRGNKQINKGFKIWFDYGYESYHIYYRPHHQTYGWGNWYHDGQDCTRDKRLEAFIYYILKY